MTAQRHLVLDKLDRLVLRASLFWVPLIACLLLVGLWVATLRVIEVERTAEVRDAQSTSQDLAGVYAALMIRALDQIDLALNTVRYAYEHQPPAKALADLQERVLVPSSLLFITTIINEDGRAVASNAKNMPEDHSRASYFRHFKGQRRGGDVLYAAPAKSPHHDIVMTFARRIFKTDGTFGGVVVISVDANYFTSWYNPTRLGQRGVIGLANSATGQLIVTRSDDKVVWSNPAGQPDSRRFIQFDHDTVYLVDNQWDGERRHMMIERLNRYPFAIFVGVSEEEHAETFELFRRAQLMQAVEFSVGICLFGIILWRMGSNQHRVRRAQETYHAASEASLDANFILDLVTDSTGKIIDFLLVDINSRALDLVGRHKPEIEGKRLSELIHGFRSTRLFRHLRVAAQTGALGQYEWESSDKEIKAKWLSAQLVPVSGGLVAIVRDISDGKRFERELLRRNDELTSLNQELVALNQEVLLTQEHLAQSERLASIGSLAAGVAHEINNPIGFVLSNVASLSEYIDSMFLLLNRYEQAEHCISDLSERASLAELKGQTDLNYFRGDIPVLLKETIVGISRVKKIVEDLNNFSRVDSPREWRRIDIHESINSTLNIMMAEIECKADVVRKYGNLPLVECLPSEINQVIFNLLVNAGHSMGENRGVITIRTGVEGDCVWIEVSDTGCGIPEEHLVHVFDPFFTTKPVGRGTGLGLSLSYGIVRKHQGAITVHSEIGKGTCFRVNLPVYVNRAVATNPTNPTNPSSFILLESPVT